MKASLVMSAFSKILLGDLFIVIINEWMNEWMNEKNQIILIKK
jgi:hypothetical protein